MNIVLVGYGRMGKEVHRVLEENGYNVVGKVERGDTFDVIKRCEVVVEFALPEATLPSLEIAKKYGKKYILGTTGHTTQQVQKIKEFGNHIPIVHSSNFSTGIALVKLAIKTLLPHISGWDVEIFEVHHRWKKDAPSGTALSLAKIFGKNININRTGLRDKNEVGVFGARGGDTFGEHTVFMFSDGERIEITHRMFSRKALAKGVVISLKFLKDKEKGYYTFDDVLFTYLP